MFKKNVRGVKNKEMSWYKEILERVDKGKVSPLQTGSSVSHFGRACDKLL